MRIATLQTTLDIINNNMGTDLQLDYAAVYGGYCLTDYHHSHHYRARMPIKQMHAFLAGMLLANDLRNASATPMAD